MSPEMFLVLLSVAGFLCFGLTLASVGWRGDVDTRIEVLEARCRRLEEAIAMIPKTGSASSAVEHENKGVRMMGMAVAFQIARLAVEAAP